MVRLCTLISNCLISGPESEQRVRLDGRGSLGRERRLRPRDDALSAHFQQEQDRHWGGAAHEQGEMHETHCTSRKE